MPEKGGERKIMVLLENPGVKLSCADDAVPVLRDLLQIEDEIDRDKEHFYVIHLNTRSVIKTVELVGLGSLNSAVVHPRETFRRAISRGACSILLAHNHPSDEVEPSEEDMKVSKAMHEAGRIVGIDVVDHLIFGTKSYFSFRDNVVHCR